MNFKNIPQPRGSQMIVEIVEHNVTDKGIVLPDKRYLDFRIGVIRALGPDVNANKSDAGVYVSKPATHRLEIGDKVILNTYQGVPLNVGGKAMTMLNADGAFAIVSE